MATRTKAPTRAGKPAAKKPVGRRTNPDGSFRMTYAQIGPRINTTRDGTPRKKKR